MTERADIERIARTERDALATLPPPGQIDLWHADLFASEESLASAYALLSADERQRAGRFRFERHHRRFVMARATLRGILARYLKTAPDAVEFSYTAFGKPYLPLPAGLHFNLSHAHEAAVYAVAGLEVGIDIEHLRPVPDALELARGNFSAAEIAALEAVASPDRSLAFLRCWTRKEAVVKACGSGLSAPLSSFTVPFDVAGGEAMIQSFPWPDAPGGASSWFLAAVPSLPGYIGAVAASQSITRIRRLAYP